MKENNTKFRESFLKKNTKYLASLCLTLLIVKDIPLVASVPLIRVKRSQIRCEPIGRIMERGEKRFDAKSLICEKESIEVLNGATIDFLCYSSGNILKYLVGLFQTNAPRLKPLMLIATLTMSWGAFVPKEAQKGAMSQQ